MATFAVTAARPMSDRAASIPHLPTGVARIFQNHRHRSDDPPATVNQPIAVGRTAARKPALHTSLRPHRRQHPLPWPRHLTLRLRAELSRQAGGSVLERHQLRAVMFRAPVGAFAGRGRYRGDMSSRLGALSSQPAVSAVDRAHSEIRAAIIEGRYEPGVMLSESDLASALGVSRTPVRTALARLQDEGWVTIYSKRGALVRGLSTEELQHSADVRQTLQIIGVERAGPGERAAMKPRLKEMLARQERALEDGPFETFVELAIEFHRVFVELAGNPLFTEFYDKLRDRQAMMLMRSAAVVRERAGDVIDEHRRLMDLAAEGDVAGFAETLRRHRDVVLGPLMHASNDRPC